MKKAYRKRRDRLIQSLKETFGGDVSVFGQSTGLHLVAEFTDTDFTPALVADIERNGVRVYPVGVHALDPAKHRNRIIIGYANLSEERITEGIRRLETALRAKVPIWMKSAR
jgi:GntR family transcriptional regulator/MocR family aminotransferase